MRIVFFGTPELAVPSLAILREHHDVVALVCQPDRPQGRSDKPVPPSTKELALERGIRMHQPTKLNDGAFEKWLRETRPELCALVAYGRILKQPILDVPAHGFLNVHPSLLPKYRGPSPIQTAVRNGETKTGVTIMRLDAGMDTGDMLLQRATDIPDDDNAETLTARVAQIGADMLLEAVGLVETGEATFMPQDHSLATVTTLWKKEDGGIRWGESARSLRNLVRACVPWPVAYCRFGGEVLRIHEAEAIDIAADAPPGTVSGIETTRILVATGDGTLAITRLQATGRKAMPTGDFLRGNRIETGDRFEDG